MIQRLGVELRATANGRTIVGHASVFGQTAEIAGGYERIAPGAFDDVLKDPATDVRALLNHDPGLVLGRQKAGTLRLSTDQIGLRFEVDLPDTTYASDLKELVRRGDLTGASFGFIPGEDKFERAKDGKQIRTHTRIAALVDVSPVTFPAYDTAGVQLRSLVIPVLSSGRRSQLVMARHRARTPKGA